MSVCYDNETSLLRRRQSLSIAGTVYDILHASGDDLHGPAGKIPRQCEVDMFC